MFLNVMKPLVGKLSTYEGVYIPHWEIEHILVRVPRTRKLLVCGIALFGLFIAYILNFLERDFLIIFGIAILLFASLPGDERWSPSFEANARHSLEDKRGPILFQGIVTSIGFYGHKGMMCRRVVVVKVLKYPSGFTSPTSL